MKYTSRIILLFLVGFFISCSDDSGEVPAEECLLIKENLAFDQIDESSDYAAVESLLGRPSASQSFGNSNTNTWYFCNNTDLYITIIRTNLKVINKVKSFSDESCSQNLTTSNFELINLGQTASEVLDILIDEGDLYAVNYNNDQTLVITEAITWYDCTDTNKRIQIRFENGIVISKEKSF